MSVRSRSVSDGRLHSRLGLPTVAADGGSRTVARPAELRAPGGGGPTAHKANATDSVAHFRTRGIIRSEQNVAAFRQASHHVCASTAGMPADSPSRSRSSSFGCSLLCWFSCLLHETSVSANIMRNCTDCKSPASQASVEARGGARALHSSMGTLCGQYFSWTFNCGARVAWAVHCAQRACC